MHASGYLHYLDRKIKRRLDDSSPRLRFCLIDEK